MLDNAEPFHRKIVDLELAEMHRVGVGPQNAQAADGQSPDGKRAHRQGADAASAPIATDGTPIGGSSRCRYLALVRGEKRVGRIANSISLRGICPPARPPRGADLTMGHQCLPVGGSGATAYDQLKSLVEPGGIEPPTS